MLKLKFPTAAAVLFLAALSLAGPSVYADAIDNLAPGTWYRVNNSNMSALNPCPSNNCSYSGNLGHHMVMAGWSGATFDTTRNRLLVWGGGHKGYSGNEVYAFDTDTLTWSRVTEPTANVGGNEDSGLYPDGTPRARHTYGSLTYSPEIDSFLAFGAPGTSPVGQTGDSLVHRLPLSGTPSWTRMASMPVSGTRYGVTAYDPNRGAVWVQPSGPGQLGKFSPTSNSWQTYDFHGQKIYATAAIDPTRDKMLVIGGTNGGQAYVWDLSNPNASPMNLLSNSTFNSTNSYSLQSRKAPGLDYDSVSDRYVLWDGGEIVYTIHPATWAVQRISPAAGNSVFPTSAEVNGTYGRFRYVPSRNAFVAVNRTTEDVYFYRLGAGGGSAPAPVITINASPSQVPSGGNTTLTWNVTSANSCTASGDWSGSRSVAGTETITNITSAQTFTLTCVGDGGSRGAEISVSVEDGDPPPTGSADWVSRASAPGVTVAINFDSPSDVSDWAVPNSQVDHVTYTTNLKRSGNGALRFDIRNTDSTDHGNWRHYLRPDQTKIQPGEEFYIQFTQYFPAYLIEHVWEGTQGGGISSGFKQMITSQFFGSNTNFEVVITNIGQRGYPQAYRQDGVVTARAFDIGASTACSGSDFRHQSAIDHGPNPLVGTNPLTGQPWTACEQDRARYGGLYSYGNQGGPRGDPDPITGAVVYPKDGWMTFLQHIRVSPNGMTSSDNLVEVWAAPDGEDYQLLISNPNVKFGGAGLFEAFWLLPYMSNGVPNTNRENTFTVYDEVIVSSDFIPAPASSGGTGQRPIVNISASSTSILEGGTVLLTWTTSGADSCVAAGDWSGSRPTDGSEVVGPLVSNSQFVLTCTNSNGSTQDSVTVTVSPPPTGDFDILRSSDSSHSDPVPLDGSNVSGELFAYVSPDTGVSQVRFYLDDPDTSGSPFNIENVPPFDFQGSFDYGYDTTQISDGAHTITAEIVEDSGAVETVTVGFNVQNQINVPPPTLNFSANNVNVDFAGFSTLQWTSSDAQSCEATGSWSGSRALNGSQSVGPLMTNSTFFLTCTGPGGSTTKTVVILVAPAPTPTVTISATPASVPYEGSSLVTWSSTDATSCTASGAWSGSRSTSGSATVGPLVADASYTLTCSGAGGNASNTATVTVGAPPLPTVTISATPNPTAYNGGATLTWSTSNANSCTASGDWSGGQPLAGSLTVGPLISDSTYILTCSGIGGSDVDEVVVVVNPANPPQITFNATPAAVGYLEASVLSWNVTDAATCTASGGWSGARGVSGSESTAPLSVDTTYTLTCDGPGGTDTQNVTVNVAAAPLPVVTFTATPDTVDYNGASQLTWSTENADSCTASGDWSGTRATTGTETAGPLQANASYTLECTGPGGIDSGTVSVTVNPPSPTVTLTATPEFVEFQGSSTLTWSSQNADSCVASGDWSGPRVVAGSEAVGPLEADSSFTLTCDGPGGSDLVTAVVTVAPAGVPSLSVQASPTEVASGGSSQIDWTAANVDTCTASGDWTGPRALSGSEPVGPLTADSTFTLSCTGPSGDIERAAIVTMLAPAATVSIDATPTNVDFDGATLLSWTATDADTCTAFGGWSGVKATSGSESVANLTQDQSFSIVCSGPGGDGNDTVAVTVNAATAPVVSLQASPGQVDSNGTSTLTWSTENATVCQAAGAWSGVRPLSGSEEIGPISASSTYTLVCSGPGGQDSATVAVELLASAPTLTIDANPSSIDYLGDTTVSWSSTGASACTAFGAWSGSKPTTGSEIISGLTKDSAFILLCTGQGGSVTESVSVIVGSAPAPDVTFMADPELVDYNQTSVLSWTSDDATECTAFGAWSGARDLDGVETVGPLTSDSNFVLLCDGPGGSTARSVDVLVALPPPPEISIVATPADIPFGDTSNISWSVNHAESCTASGDWSGSVELDGSTEVGPLFATSTFTLVCIGGGGNSSQSVSVNVAGAAQMTLQDFTDFGPGDAVPGWFQTGENFTNAFLPFTFVVDEQNANRFMSLDKVGFDYHNHYLQGQAGLWRDYRYTGRFYLSAPSDRLGVTFLSAYPQSDAYYRLGYEANGGAIRLNARGTTCNGDLSTGVVPAAGQWYRFNIEAESSTAATEIRARVWADGDAEPSVWQAQCLDDSSARRLSGSVGVWGSRGAAANQAYWDDLMVAPIDSEAVFPPTLNLTVTPPVVAQGGFASIDWSSGNADDCVAAGGWTGARGAAGSELVGPLQDDDSFSLTCNGPGGSVTRVVAVGVVTDSSPPVVTMSADPVTVPTGGSTTLTWNATNSAVCAASGDWSGVVAPSGSQVISSIVRDSTFQLNCIGPAGNVAASVDVLLSDIPRDPQLSLDVDFSRLSIDNTVNLSWESLYASTCVASGSWSGDRSISGLETVGPIAVEETYVLTCSGNGGSVSSQVIVNFVDSDADGMPDVWEQQYFGNLDNTGLGDTDGDGLTDRDEYISATNPLNVDTDGDGATDLEEIEFGSDPLDFNDVFESNRPQRPVLTSVDNAPLWGLTMDATNGYLDPDGDPLGYSEWQFSLNAGFTGLVFSRKVEGRTDVTVPAGVLDPAVGYFVRSRHVDSRNIPSEWSLLVAVRMSTSYPNDSDGDGIDDDYQAPADADANGNGVPDLDEGICNLLDAEGRSLIGFETNSGVSRCYRSVPNSDITSATDIEGERPFGFFSFRVEGLFVDKDNPSRVFVTVWMPESLDTNTGWVLFDQAAGELVDYSDNATINGSRVIIEYTDGGLGDEDGVVNGVIVDPSGPLVPVQVAPPNPTPPPTPTSPKPEESGGGGSGSTAPFGLLILSFVVLRRRQLRGL